MQAGRPPTSACCVWVAWGDFEPLDCQMRSTRLSLLFQPAWPIARRSYDSRSSRIAVGQQGRAHISRGRSASRVQTPPAAGYVRTTQGSRLRRNGSALGAVKRPHSGPDACSGYTYFVSWVILAQRLNVWCRL